MTLLAFTALAVDISYVRVIDLQLQQATDAAVLAGVGNLDGTYVGIQSAREATIAVGNANAVMGTSDVFTGDMVEFGAMYKDDDGYRFEPRGTTDPDDVADINAIRLRADEDQIGTLIASAAWGIGSLRSQAESTAVRPFNWSATAVDCFLPMALPDCNFDPDATSNPTGAFVSGSSQLGDNVGWAGLSTVSASYVRGQLRGTCNGGELHVGDDMNLNNGIIDRALQEMGVYLRFGAGGTDTWNTNFPPVYQGDPETVTGEFPSSWSRVNNEDEVMSYILAGPVPIVNMDGEPGAGCDPNDAGEWNASQEIVGFTYGFVYDVVKDGNLKGFFIQMDYVNDYDLATEVGPGAIGNIVDSDAPPYLVP